MERKLVMQNGWTHKQRLAGKMPHFFYFEPLEKFYTARVSSVFPTSTLGVASFLGSIMDSIKMYKRTN